MQLAWRAQKGPGDDPRRLRRPRTDVGVRLDIGAGAELRWHKGWKVSVVVPIGVSILTLRHEAVGLTKHPVRRRYRSRSMECKGFTGVSGVTEVGGGCGGGGGVTSLEACS